MPDRLTGKVAVITGVARGMGRAASELFAREGAVVCGCDLDGIGLQETECLVRDGGGTIETREVDLSQDAQVKAWIDSVGEAHGRIDVLYNNASSPRFAPISDMAYEDWLYTMRNEIDVVYLPTRHAWPYLVASGRASVINVGSIAGMVGALLVPAAAHATAKGAVTAFTRQLAAEGARHGIRANTISPGSIDTPVHDEDKSDDPALVDMGERCHMLGRFGRAEEVAEAAVFLASDDASFITGVNLPVDGGFTALWGLSTPRRPERRAVPTP